LPPRFIELETSDSILTTILIYRKTWAMRPAFKLFAAAFLLLVTQIALAGPLITVYKNPTCGCCKKWVEYLQKEGFEVKAVNRDDLAPIKKQAGVPPAMSACHTALVDGYVIEGHVPAQAIRPLSPALSREGRESFKAFSLLISLSRQGELSQKPGAAKGRLFIFGAPSPLAGEGGERGKLLHF